MDKSFIEGIKCCRQIIASYRLGAFARLWRGQPRPKGFRRQMMRGACYRNATLLSQRNDELIYCEGYAGDVPFVQHAWVVDQHGYVIDPTWPYRPTIVYVGIPFRTSWIRYNQIRTARFDHSLLDARIAFDRGVDPYEVIDLDALERFDETSS